MILRSFLILTLFPFIQVIFAGGLPTDYNLPDGVSELTVNVTASDIAFLPTGAITSGLSVVQKVGGAREIVAGIGSQIEIGWGGAPTRTISDDSGGGPFDNELAFVNANENHIAYIYRDEGMTYQARVVTNTSPPVAVANLNGSTNPLRLALDSNGKIYINENNQQTISTFSDYSAPADETTTSTLEWWKFVNIRSDGDDIYALPEWTNFIYKFPVGSTNEEVSSVGVNNSGMNHSRFHVDNRSGKGVILSYSEFRNEAWAPENAVRIFRKDLTYAGIITEANLKLASGDAVNDISISGVTSDVDADGNYNVYVAMTQAGTTRVVKLTLPDLKEGDSSGSQSQSSILEAAVQAVTQTVSKQLTVTPKIRPLVTKLTRTVAARVSAPTPISMLSGVSPSVQSNSGFGGVESSSNSEVTTLMLRSSKSQQFTVLTKKFQQASQLDGINALAKLTSDGKTPDLSITEVGGRKHSLWMRGSYDYGTNSENGEAPGSTDNAASVTLGIESANHSQTHLMGFALTAGERHSESSQNALDKNRTKFWQATLYNGWNVKPNWRWSQFASYGKGYTDGQRSLDAGARAFSKFADSNIALGSSISYMKYSYVVPNIGFSWWRSARPGYLETEAGNENLNFDSQKSIGLDLNSSVSFSKPFKVGVFDAGVNLTFGYTYLAKSPKITENVMRGSASAKVEFPDLDRHSFDATLDFSVAKANSWDINLSGNVGWQQHRKDIGVDLKVKREI